MTALDDDETPIYKTWRCQTLSQTSTSKFNRHLKDGNKTRCFSKAITDLGDQDKVSSRGKASAIPLMMHLVV
jgi:hypothetical protein